MGEDKSLGAYFCHLGTALCRKKGGEIAVLGQRSQQLAEQFPGSFNVNTDPSGAALLEHLWLSR